MLSHLNVNVKENVSNCSIYTEKKIEKKNWSKLHILHGSTNKIHA